jgi:hypothetical protein
MPPAIAGWQQLAGKAQLRIAIHRPVSRLFFFSLFLPLMRKQPIYTCMLKNLLKLYCIWTWDTLWVFLLLLFCAVLFYLMFPLWWDNYWTTYEAPSPELETEGWTPKLLILKLHCIWTWRFLLLFLFFIYFLLFYFLFILFYIYIFLSFTYFLFLFLSSFFLFFISNPLSVSLMPFQLTVN